MLIEFTTGNYRSFKDTATLSMAAARIKARDPHVNANNTIPVDNQLTLLTSAAIYGANASGKSNFIHALEFMRRFVLTSSKETQSAEPISYRPYRLNTASENAPSLFEIVFRLSNLQYRYGFEIDAQQVVAEWLFSSSGAGKETRMFVRQAGEIHRGRVFKEGKGLEKLTRANALFLSVVAQFNGQTATQILGWFRQLWVIAGLQDSEHRIFTIQRFKEQYHQQILDLIKRLDLGIDDIQTEPRQMLNSAGWRFPLQDTDGHLGIKLELEGIPPEMQEQLWQEARALDVRFVTIHQKYDEKGQPGGKERFDLELDESDGTAKLFYLAGPLVDVLERGGVIVIDEMEARTHPLINLFLISLFNSLETNPKRAQLIFTTHDTNLLSNQLFRRDQIWFIEKDQWNASHLYSLAEIKVRNDASFENDYLKGRYGGVPFPGDIRKITIEEDKGE